jgi:hypothetical protein
MATDIAKIHIGQGDVWLGGTAPTAGLDLTDPTSSSINTMTTNFAAPTSGGTAVGFTNGPATLTYKPTYYNVETEQAFAEVLVIPTAEECSVEFTMLESSYTNLNKAMGQATSEVNAGVPINNTNFVGGKPTVNTFLLVLNSRKRTGTGYYLLTVYQVYSMDGVTLNFERRKEMQNKVTMRALADTSRPVGDQLFQLAEFTANPA